MDLYALAGKTGNLAFFVTNATSGSIVLLGDGRTARFTPTNDFTGLASFNFNVTNLDTMVSFGPVRVGVLVAVGVGVGLVAIGLLCALAWHRYA